MSFRAESIIRAGSLPLSIEHSSDKNLNRGYHVKKQFHQHNMHHHRNFDFSEDDMLQRQRMPTEEDQVARLYIENSNPNASYDPGLKYASSFDERSRRIKPNKRTGAHFNPMRIDPRKIKEAEAPVAGVNTNYGLGGGHASYIAQGSGTGTLNVHKPQLSSIKEY